MISRSKALLAALALVALAGCATPEKVALNKEAAGEVDTVTLVVAPDPKKYTISNLAHPGLMFGLVGGAIAAADQANKENRFARIAHSEKFSVSSALAKAVEQKLVAAGYKVRLQDGQWEEKDGKLSLQADKFPAEAGAILVVSPTIVGFVAGYTDKTHYLPTIHAAATLLGKDRKTALYKGFHSTGWQPNGEAWRHTKAQKTFADFDALVAQPKESTAALELSAEAISTSIAEDLRR